MARSGEVLERRAGLKKFAIRSAPDGGTVDEDVAADLVESLCLSDEQLQALSGLADDCERVYGAERDIEWAFADGQLYLLQCRAVTTSAGAAATGGGEGAGGLGRVTACTCRCSPNLAEPDRDAIARLFTQRVFAPGETVTKEGADAAAFYLIESGTATVTVRRRVPAHAGRRGPLRRDRPDRRARPLGHGDRRRRARLPGHHAVGLPAAGAAQPDHGVDAAADTRRHAARDR